MWMSYRCYAQHKSNAKHTASLREDCPSTFPQPPGCLVSPPCPCRHHHHPLPFLSMDNTSSDYQMAESLPNFGAQAQKMANLQTTTEASMFLLGGLLGGCMLVGLIRSPLTMTYIVTGRFKQGWTLRRNQQTSEITSFRNWRVKGSRFTISGLRPLKSQKLLVGYLYWYNKLTIQSIWGSRHLTLAKLLVGLFYLTVISISILWKNWRAQDFLSHFRRPATIAVFQLPIIFLLSMKNNLSGFSGIGYERINFLHRLVGRTVLLCSILHAALILKVQESALGELFKQSTFMYGGISLATMIFVAFTSMAPIRKRFYRCFLASHILGYLLLLFALWMHVQATHVPIMICGGLKIVDEMFKIFNTSFRRAQFTSLPGKITTIEVPNLGTGWRAGQFVFLRVYSSRYILEKHPFTIANAPASDSPHRTKNSLVLIAKANGDYTRKLHEIGLTKAAMGGRSSISRREISTQSQGTNQLLVSVEGPYGHMYHDLRSHETVVLIGAGVACTFVMALFEEVVGSAIAGVSSTRNVLIYWTLRDIDMVEYFLDPIRENLRMAQAMEFNEKHYRYRGTDQDPRDINYRKIQTGTIPRTDNNPWKDRSKEVIIEAVNTTISEINALGRSEQPAGIGIASATGSASFSKALRDATLAVDRKTFTEIGGITLHTEIFDNQ
ncbi:hypothetical protein Pst134EA_032253 [Puccinia striiformis f. sp. tritici]|uniref:uncharacterized protein n=1 Tax=Puccinia striiformis f. sp. tritici TaxID=168172 RepID=UPI002008B148|nr:uncharacterized protein Pst134EA_032253 [Puccinia striiformis f. sp. tritici]KAH9440662.1 hypothetical protein Pst134EA_032253 [Puccinia striiformis f. sp. tritici]